MNVKPVMFPPGWAKPATKPCPTGSLTRLNTIGMLAVACLIARITDELLATATSGAKAASSAL